ncbi:MAG: hypothetical protein HWD61_02265 [Parachlamydiaceae bacterium]|nr:MAG: hypothetical protein HWD61_02265 [Parachlamydiaceae bacterium]
MHSYNPLIPAGTQPWDSVELMRVFLKIFKTPQMQIISTLENGQKISTKERSLVIITDNGATQETGILKDFETKTEDSFQPLYLEMTNLNDNLAPLFIPVLIYRNDTSDRIPIPKNLTFSNLQGKSYRLIACQSGSHNHAYAFVKSQDDWVKYNDSSVARVNEEEAFNEMSKMWCVDLSIN